MADRLSGKVLSRRSCAYGESGVLSQVNCPDDISQSALSGLDIALWDIKGKKLGVPVWQLLGGKVRDRVRVYGWIGGDSPTEVFEAAKVRAVQGFTAVKMNGTGLCFFGKNPFIEFQNVF
jgi:L-alanine-DL-glutamate epimerase-like enolase superfamily enzyme